MSAVLKFENKQNEIISHNPATGERIGSVRNTSPEEAQIAVENARKAFQTWRRTSYATRKKIVMKAREIILSEMDEIALLISNESGKPVAEALSMEIAPVLDLMQYFARNAESFLKPRKINIGLYSLLDRSSKIVYQPLGVVGIIPAWNYPFSIPLGEIAMALMAANKSGKATGRSKIGSNISCVRVWVDIAASNVPTAAYPIEPSRIIRINPGMNKLIL